MSANKSEKHELPDLGPKYEIVRFIGQGGMGTVYEVVHKLMQRRRAVKVLDRGLMNSSQDYFSRFQQEARITTELSHPNIVRVHDLDRAPDGTPFILMEYLEGHDLEWIILTRAPLPLKTVVCMLAGPADALDEVHRMGVLHRDLKPGNFYSTTDGETKILDFGISQFRTIEDQRITKVGEVVGTPLYMSPEQLKGEAMDGRSDIYSLAAVAYEMLTGNSIFPFKTISQLTASVLIETPVPPCDWNPALPPHVDEVFARALAKNPDDRYGTAVAFIRALAGPELSGVISSQLRHERLGLALSSTTTLPAQKAGKTGSLTGALKLDRLPWYWWALAVAVTLILGVGALLAVNRLKADEKVQQTLVLSPIRINGADVESAWTQKSLDRVIRQYLSLTPELRVLSSENSAAFNAGNSETDGTLEIAATKDKGEWAIEMNVRASRGGASFWKTTSKSAGWEAAVEETTFALSEYVRGQVSQATADGQPAKNRRAMSSQAFEAISKGAFLLRSERLAAMLKGSAEGTFWKMFNAYLRCAATMSSLTCLSAGGLIKPLTTEDDRVNALWRIMAQGSEKSVDERCGQLSQADEGLGGLRNILPGAETCEFGMAEICRNLDSFWDRYACVARSSRNDSHKVALAYLYRMMEVDDGHAFYGGLDVFFRHDMGSPTGEMWLHRMQERYGTNEPVLSGTLFASAMAQRKYEDAIIWARRSEGLEDRLGLALIGAGWLNEGVRKTAEALNARISSGGMSDRDATDEIKRSIFTIVATREPLLARTWLAQMGDIRTDQPELRAAAVLMRALSENTVEEICAANPTSNFLATETAYLCRKFEAISQSHHIRPSLINSSMGDAFYFAESQFQTGHVEESLALFTAIESEMFFRINYPAAATLAMNRMAHALRSSGRNTEARVLYEQFLSLWNGLEIPLEEYFETERLLTSL